MNHSNWSAYMYDIHEYMRQQQALIQQLLSRVNELEEKLQNTKSNRIEKVEYHFDQLKIEQLDGTLHIGLSPQDLANLEEDCSIGQVKPPNYQPPLKQTIQAELNDYLHQNGPAMIRQLASEYNVGVDDGYPSILIQDMIKQLPGRIAFYEKEAHNQKNLRTKEELHAYIADKIKNEIDQSLRKYMDTQR
ncbi:putative spore germination protein GerPC [Virgibacillus pantothenticus]|uniref:Uncharacterized protein n=1 Tax=Virgibacillus pantothenticus TaxID=1473 RepID=A0A0L0QUY0_VIRPA|nr:MULTISPECIES: spore germination protein GerPC [Virgibacillus]API91044.1 hypothetical protein BKP57_03735 [Virgibacillus sp. 6R]KNE21998.1 hypothetical protein AFK71_04130 [Virgibacillus pantothenticus]MBS7429033.1 hypothetical protein [Virgibacillus sp. 19R1-5]MBU8566786.1 spore germination protein GerPC [Virgibacillus pantothenticus]MBU8600368.1 spore germination protein GerPC [Virgibacillus pantothenticus]